MKKIINKIENLDPFVIGLTYMLTQDQLTIWTGAGYDGATFIKLIK